MNTRAERIRRAIAESGKTAAEVADLMGVTRGYVSQWSTGRGSPPADRLLQLADVLQVSAAWLRGDDEPEDAFPEATWSFRVAPADGGRDYGNANVFATPADIATFVRETGQNVRDASLRSAASQTHIRYSLIELAIGTPEYTAFEEAARFDLLLPHVQKAALTDSKLGARLRGGLERLSESGKLVLMRVDDFGTTGLFGKDQSTGDVTQRDRNPFAALVKNNLDSSKLTATAAGSFGLGKAVLWRCSDLSTVLFATDIAAGFRDDEYPPGYYRVSGKTELTWHRLDRDDHPYAGPGWLSQSETDAASLRTDNRGYLRALQLDRARLPDGVDPTRASGTSILIIGFRDPKEQQDFDSARVAETLREAAAKAFWPLMVQGRIAVTVERIEGARVVDTQVVQPEVYVPELCDALRRHEHDEVSEILSDPGDVARFSIPLGVSRTRPNARGVQQFLTDLEARCHLLVRLAEEDPVADKEVDSVALIRGAGMIVKYLPRRNIVVGGRAFHAILLAGEAAGSDDASIAAEQLLRTAEPPAHDEWEYNDDLRSKYYPGPGARLRELFDAITETLRQAIRPTEDGEERGPRELQKLLQLTTNRPKPAPPATIRKQMARIADGAWIVSGEIHVNDKSKAWRIRPRIWLDVESGAPVRLEWASLETDRAEIDSGALVTARGIRRVPFRGVSQRFAQGIPAADCRLKLDLRADPIREEN